MSVCASCGAAAPPGSQRCYACGAQLASGADPLIGTVLPRRYRILSRLGTGTMGVVYKGVYEPLDQPVAIKMLKWHLVQDVQVRKRFALEQKTAWALNHPNVIGIIDSGVSEQGVPYIVMEYLEGRNLQELIGRGGRPPLGVFLHIFAQVAAGLACAHKQGVIHRDIKPSNILVMEHEDDPYHVKILDFGIAKLQNIAMGAEGGLTRTGEVLGTPLYMSPEQSLGKELDGRSDIYALGCVMFETLSGKPPFLGNAPVDTMKLHIMSPPPTLEEIRPGINVPERLKAVIYRCLAKDPRQRYQFAEDLQADLKDIASHPDSGAELTGQPAAALPLPTKWFPMPGRETLVPAAIVCAAICALLLLWTAISFFSSLRWADEGRWKRYTRDGQAAAAAGRYGEAENSYRLALDEAAKFKQPDRRKAVSLNDLAASYCAQGEYGKAESAARQALTLFQTVKASDPDIADALSTLEQVYSASGKYTQAEQLGLQALSMRQKALGPAHADVASSLIALAELSCHRGNYKDADRLYTGALTITETALGADSTETSAVLHNLGMVYEQEGLYGKAADAYQRALGIRQKVTGLESPLVGDTLKALATLKFVQRKDSEAEALFYNALAISKKNYGEDDPHTAEVLTCLARLYDQQKDFTKATDNYRKALQINEKFYGAESPKILHNLDNMAAVLRKAGTTSGAEAYEEDARRIRAGKKK